MEERLQYIENIPKIIQLSVGSEHNVALTGKLLYVIKCINAKEIKDMSNNYNFM